MGFALESFTCGLDEQIDVIPVDYCAEALIGLALKPCLGHSLYHISAGHRAACTFGEIDEAFIVVVYAVGAAGQVQVAALGAAVQVVAPVGHLGQGVGVGVEDQGRAVQGEGLVGDRRS